MMNYSPMSVRIPKGLGPGDVPAGLAWPRRLWLILPESASQSQNESIHRARAKLRGHDNIAVSEVKVKNVKGAGGFTFPLISAKDVAGLYRGAHRARSAVISFCGAKILLDIGEIPTNKGCMALEKFVEYKCSYELITRPEEVENVLAKTFSWLEVVNCEGPHDPRCLPAAVFEKNRDYRLESQRERKSFIDDHTPAKNNNTLTDVRGRQWQIGPNHTRDLLHVAGRTLPIGFHWDVQASRKSSIIATGWETWNLPGGAYVNIHPDAYIRGNKARKIHSLTVGTNSPKIPRTPRSTREGRGASF